MNDPGRLLADGLDNARMSMTKGVHSQPGHEVEILLALEVIEKNALPALKAHGIAVIGREKKAFFKIGNLVEARHGFIVERALGGRTSGRTNEGSAVRRQPSTQCSLFGGDFGDSFRSVQTASDRLHGRLWE
jgi:hypothetical protein